MFNKTHWESTRCGQGAAIGAAFLIVIGFVRAGIAGMVGINDPNMGSAIRAALEHRVGDVDSPQLRARKKLHTCSRCLRLLLAKGHQGIHRRPLGLREVALD